MNRIPKRFRLALVVLLLVAGAGAWALAGPGKARRKKPRSAVDVYVKHVQPIFEAHCYRCHGPTKRAAGLRLDTVAHIRKGGIGGPALIPGDSEHSLLVKVLTGADDQPRMPPASEPLTPNQIVLVRAWIDSGAPAPAEAETDSPESGPPAPREHWAFRPPVAAPVPGEPGAPAANPIDAFLSAGRSSRGLVPNAPAPPAVLLRRVTIDLIGIPPTREELAAFLAAPSDAAYEAAVERLLASPQYGERWARHWMDVWRYSDADGRKAKADIWWGSPHVWRWRDWIVRALNADAGYDRMVRDMLAGDEVAPAAPDALAATGFLVRNWFKLDRNIGLENAVDHTAKAFLGLSLGCARCHDHKFDPLAQTDYYRFRAFFEPHDVRTDPVPGEKGPAAHFARAFDARPDEPTWVFVRGDTRNPDKAIHIVPGVPPVLGGTATVVPPEGGASTGRRLALARWIGDRANPLTARVAVNHIWARHFGRPLVENVADFGTRTPAPAQQPLLDWLAVEFMDRGWSTKRLHRLMVTSAAYRMHSSTRDSAAGNRTADPDNAYYWRATARRMEAEVVRDSLLALAGVLEPTAGGPPVDHARGTDTGRRSLYYRHSREDKMEFLRTFDAPGVEECYRRSESVVPQQALALENSAFAWDQARRIARRLEPAAPGAAFVPAAFEHVLGRAPTRAEIETCEAFLARQADLLSDPTRLTPLPPVPPPAPADPELAKRVPGLPLVLGDARPLAAVPPAPAPAARAREYLVHALLNHNDFITVR